MASKYEGEFKMPEIKKEIKYDISHLHEEDFEIPEEES